MADVRIVKQKLRQLLQGVDFEVETQRSITHRLEQDLGVSLSQHKPLIKEEIDAFLTEHQDAEGDADSDFEAEAPAPPPSKKQKAAGGGAAAASPPGDCVVALSPLRFVTVRQYSGKTMVDVREFYEQDGKLQPGRKGVALQAAAWGALAQQLGAVSTALAFTDESFSLDLGASKRATISAFKGRHSVDLREYYEKDGEMLPGKKGIALSADEWGKLCMAAAHISQQLQARGSGGGATTSGGASTAVRATAAPAGGCVGPSGAGAAADGASGGAGAAAGGSVDLSGTRHADVSQFKSAVYCNIREYYEKDGQMLPGKKGISLPRDQFAKLNQHAAELDAALRERNTEYEVQLSSKRKATITCFKGRYMVNIREYYEKDGQLLPGQKGISLPEDQWGKLLGGLPGLAAALAKA